jgi:hypothetical protein
VTQTIIAQVRPSFVNAAVIQLQQTVIKPNISLSESSAIVSAGIGAINSITRDTTVDNQQKETAITATAAAINVVASSTTTTGANKAEAIKASAVQIATVVKAVVKDPTVSLANRNSIIDATTTMVTKVADSTSTATQKAEQTRAVVAAVASVVSNTAISADDKKNFVDSTATIVNNVATKGTLTAQAKTDLIKIVVATIVTVANDNNLNPIEKRGIFTFADVQFTTIIANPTLTTSAGVAGALTTLVNETKAISAAVGADTTGTVKVEDAIKTSETKVADAVKTYGAP